MAKLPTKTCLKCNKKQPLTNYYKNTKYKDAQGYDIWCKDCLVKYVTDKETLIDYCYQNKREFSDELYDRVEKKVEFDLDKDLEYIKTISVDKKLKYRFELIRKEYFRQMNMKKYYKFVETVSAEDQISNYLEEQVIKQSVEAAKEMVDDQIKNMMLDQKQHYDPIWKGEFTDWELNYLNEYYHSLEIQFDISDSHMEDNFRKVAKASLEETMAYNAMRRGESGADKRHEAATRNYIQLSDQAKLSSSKRTANDRIGFSDLGSLIKMIEDKGALCRKQNFDKDDVDVVLEDFYHAFRSFNPAEIKQAEELEEDDF